jgi:hypothetical protein
MGGERASSVRMRLSGKICCNCGAILPLPHVHGERHCEQCAPRHRIYMHFMRREGWYCQFLEADLKTPLPKKLTIVDSRKLLEMAERGGVNPENRAVMRRAIEKGVGGIWLDLTAEQYAKLKRS